MCLPSQVPVMLVNDVTFYGLYWKVRLQGVMSLIHTVCVYEN